MTDIVEGLLREFHGRTPIRVGSLIVTIFGDAISPRGGRLSMASLLEMTRAFGIADGLVRTAMSRLVGEGWLARWKVGRNSFYQLSPQGETTFSDAAKRIYGPVERSWGGKLEMVLLDAGGDRARLRAQFEALGFGALTPEVLVAPVGLGAMAAWPEGGFFRLEAGAAAGYELAALGRRAWAIDELGERYARFNAVYRPALKTVMVRNGESDLQALVMRLLLIHDYRRVVLRDPLLPAALLPVPWAGTAAREMAAALYRRLLPAAERWLDVHASDDRGPLRPPDAEFKRRFAEVAGGSSLKSDRNRR